MANLLLNRARDRKDDEFYTRLLEITKECCHYTEHFRDKVVYCNCDGEESNFVKYFRFCFDELQLRDLLISNCDFRSEESIAKLRRADVVVTNPPFSLFRPFVHQLMEYEKKFLILGATTAITYAPIAQAFLAKKIWLGVSPRSMLFERPDGATERVGAGWYTNLPHGYVPPPLELTQRYDPDIHPKYDNINAIEVSRVKDIPYDYDGPMGVPLTFLNKHNPDQFEICGTDRHINREDLGIERGVREALVHGKRVFSRIIIKKIP